MKVIKSKLKDTEAVIKYTESNPEIVYTQTYEMLNYSLNKNKKITMTDLFHFKLTDDEELNEVILTVNEDEWNQALEMSLLYFEEVENYEMCSKVQTLIETIKIK
jgi:hypothetical protein